MIMINAGEKKKITEAEWKAFWLGFLFMMDFLVAFSAFIVTSYLVLWG